MYELMQDLAYVTLIMLREECTYKAEYGIVDLFDLILYVPVNNLSDMSGRVFLG